MNSQTWREFKKANPKATVDDWLALHTTKGTPNVMKHEKNLDNVSKLYGNKKHI